MHSMITKLPAALAVGMLALAACTPGEPGSVNPASIGDGSSLTRADQRALKPAPTPALGTVGVPTAPSFGPGVGAGINTGIGIQRYNGLVP
jgi:hypothetical protein